MIYTDRKEKKKTGIALPVFGIVIFTWCDEHAGIFAS